MDLWQYILTSTPSLGLWEWLVIFASALVAIWSIVLPNRLMARQPATGSAGAGLRENGLRAELWIKVGTEAAVWCGALILSLLLRLVGTYGLSTHLLTTLVPGTAVSGKLRCDLSLRVLPTLSRGVPPDRYT